MFFKIKKLFMVILGVFYACSQLSAAFATDSADVTIAVLELDAVGVPPSAARTLSNVLRQELLGCKGYLLVDRYRMEEILTEQGFQQTGCVSQECAVEAGHLLGVQKMITGSVSILGKMYLINLQLIDVASGEIERMVSEQFVGNLEELVDPVKRLAHRIIGEVTAIQSESFLYVSSDPEGATLYIDDKYIGNTPVKIPVTKEQVTVRVTQTGYSQWKQIVTVNKGKITIIEAKLIPQSNQPSEQVLGFLLVSCDTDGIPLYIDGGYVGDTPFVDPISISPGTHQLSLIAPEKKDEIYRNYEKAVGSSLSLIKRMNFSKQKQAVDAVTSRVFVSAGDTIKVDLEWEQYEKINHERVTKIRKINGLIWGFAVLFILMGSMGS